MARKNAYSSWIDDSQGRLKWVEIGDARGRDVDVEAVTSPAKRLRRGRPPKAEAPRGEVRYRLVIHAEAVSPSADAHGWTVLATTLRPEVCTDAELLQAY